MITTLLALALLPAHPLGNFSVNQLVELTLHQDRVAAVSILDLAELPTLQSKTEPGPACAAFARDLELTVNGTALTWQVGKSELSFHPGAAGLQTSRLSCELVAHTDLDSPAELTVVNRHLPERLGWRELTARGDGVIVSGLPATSVTDGLTRYPDDQLDSPPDVREAHLTSSPGTAVASLTDPAITPTPGLLARAEGWLQANVSSIELTPLAGLLAVALAIVLGASHAALPGHGKTVMAVYLAGRAGRRRDAVLVGATVTATHTGGVLLLGLLLSTTTWLAGETVLGWLGLASGALIIIVALTMLRHPHPHPHSHTHDPHNREPHGHEPHRHEPHRHEPHRHEPHRHEPHRHEPHAHEATHAHEAHGWNAHGATHAHEAHGRSAHGDGVPGNGARGNGVRGHVSSSRGRGEGLSVRRGLAALGVAGGLVPSPSALVVLLGAIALGRTGFGVLLVLAYGLGMAGMLTLAGLTLLSLRDRFSWIARLLTRTPRATGLLILVVGLALAARSAVAI